MNFQPSPMSPSSPNRVHDHSELTFDHENYGRNHLRSRSQRQGNHRIGSHRVPSTSGIPMPSYHIQRTESEAQLHEDMAMAEYRDRCMFNRLVTGIQRQQQEQLHYDSQQHQFYQQQNDPTSMTRDQRKLQQESLDQETHRTENCHNSSMITPIASDGEETGTRTRRSNVMGTAAAAADPIGRDQLLDVDDWAIGGFDDDDEHPTSSKAIFSRDGDQMQVTDPSSSHPSLRMHKGSSNDQLFDMDL